MRLKSFTAPTLPEAMSRVREALGPDAVILSTQPAEAGPGVRITAALEDSPLDELDFGHDSGGPPAINVVAEALSFHRVPAGLFDRLIGAAVSLSATDPVMALAGALDAELSFGALPDPGAPRPVMLAGAPGAGKTATAAKLCARARLAGRSVALITMDSAKAGGWDQATTFAKALEAHLVRADTTQTLVGAVSDCPKDRFVVIDTVATNPCDADDLGRLSRAAESVRADLVLVLPAGGDAAENAEAATAFADAGARSVIVTRVDAARRFGGLLSAARAADLPLISVTMAPSIGEPLMPMNPISLARLLLAGGTPVQTAAHAGEES